MDIERTLKNLESKRDKAMAGEIWSINDAKARGHKGRLLSRKENNVEAAIFTHAEETNRVKNIKLQENPDPKDTRDSYVVKKKHKTTIEKLGKRHSEMTIKNKTDKSVLRHIKKGK